MNERAVLEFAQYGDDRLFATVADGLHHMKNNALGLWRDFRVLLNRGRRQSATIVRGFVEEEAAKFFLLLDVVRCPHANARFGSHLTAFYDHTAKGIYARHYEYQPANFAEVAGYVANLRTKYYLDGPEGFEWIFRNEILDRREAAIYVNYVRNDDRAAWSTPRERAPFDPFDLQPPTLALARRMCRIGMASPESLRAIATLWRPFPIEPATSWGDIVAQNRRTIEHLHNDLQLLDVAYLTDAPTIVGQWTFPLWPLDLRLDGTRLDEVIAEQGERRVAFERNVYGVPDDY